MFKVSCRVTGAQAGFAADLGLGTSSSRENLKSDESRVNSRNAVQITTREGN
jgi:hypothetical protein